MDAPAIIRLLYNKDICKCSSCGGKIVKAYVPLAEMFGYSTDLRSKTQGRGNYSMFFEKYEQVPKSVQEKILSKKD